MSAWNGDTKPKKSLTTTKEIERVLPALTEVRKCLISGILGSMAFYGGLITIPTGVTLMTLVISVIIGFVVAIASYPILGTFKKTTKIKIEDNTSREMMSEAENKLEILRGHLTTLRNEPYKRTLLHVISETNKLIEDLYRHPDKIFDSRDFLGYYLESLEVILSKSLEITDPSEKINHIKSVDKLLNSVYNAVVKRRKSLHNSNMKEVEVEITLLRNELKSKGF